MDNIILVDTSYTSFYRFFATLRWMSHFDKKFYDKNVHNMDYDWSNDHRFMNTYTKMYLESIKKLVGSKIFKSSKIIFCMDSNLLHGWRIGLFPQYKAQRPDLAKKYNFSAVFKKTKYEIIPNLVKQNEGKIYYLLVDGAEADDVIAVISGYYQLENPDMNIYIISADSDFHQLGRENVFFANYKKKHLLNISKQEAQIILKNKILNGDPCDNIPSIFPKMSFKKKKAIIENNDMLIQFLEYNNESMIQFELNRKLIDFSYIPKKIISGILTKYLAMDV